MQKECVKKNLNEPWSTFSPSRGSFRTFWNIISSFSMHVGGGITAALLVPPGSNIEITRLCPWYVTPILSTAWIAALMLAWLLKFTYVYLTEPAINACVECIWEGIIIVIHWFIIESNLPNISRKEMLWKYWFYYHNGYAWLDLVIYLQQEPASGGPRILAGWIVAAPISSLHQPLVAVQHQTETSDPD